MRASRWDHPTSPGSLTWSPDSASLYFLASDDKTADEKEKDKVRDDVYTFEENNFKQRHLWMTDLEGKSSRITQGDWTVSGYDLSVDGRRIAMTRTPSPLLEFTDRTEVWVMDATGANAKQLTSNKVPESNASLSPDGKTVLFTSGSNEAGDIYYNDKIFLVPASGGAALHAEARTQRRLAQAEHCLRDIESALTTLRKIARLKVMSDESARRNAESGEVVSNEVKAADC